MRRKSEALLLAKVAGLSVLVVMALVFLALRMVFPIQSAPKDEEVVQEFYAYRAAFKRSRNMLLEDKPLVRVADWEFQTRKLFGTHKPTERDFPVDRLNQYISLLKEIGAPGAFRDRVEPPESVGVLVHAFGFAEDTRHLDVCWMSQAQPNQVSSLGDFYKTPKPRKPVYRHIEGDGYLWAEG